MSRRHLFLAINGIDAPVSLCGNGAALDAPTHPVFPDDQLCSACVVKAFQELTSRLQLTRDSMFQLVNNISDRRG